MATLRLDDGSRSQIIAQFRAVMNRVMHNKTFPIEENDTWEFGLSLLPENVRASYLHVFGYNESMVREQRWHPEVNLVDGDTMFQLCMYGAQARMPYDKMNVPRTHPKHQELVEYATAQIEAQKHLSMADGTLTHIIHNCTSIGQVKRIMEKDADLLRFVPDYMKESFAKAERRSRVPKSFNKTAHDLRHLGNVLATGSLSPETIVGMRATVESKELKPEAI